MSKRLLSPGLLVVLAALALAGCASRKINWAPRVGHYTLDQTILEIGPPDKHAQLSDGAVVAEWLTQRGRPAVYTGYRGYYGNYGYPVWPYYGGFYPGLMEPGMPDYFLRLTFGPDGKLSAWKRFSR